MPAGLLVRRDTNASADSQSDQACDSATQANCSPPSPYVFIALAAVLFALLLTVVVMSLISRYRDRRRGQGNPGPQGGQRRTRQAADDKIKDGIELQTLDSVCPAHIHGLDEASKGSKVKIDLETGFARDVCAVCLELLTDQDEVRRLKCAHVFHTSCIDSWFKGRHYDCPMCRIVYVERPTVVVVEEV